MSSNDVIASTLAHALQRAEAANKALLAQVDAQGVQIAEQVLTIEHLGNKLATAQEALENSRRDNRKRWQTIKDLRTRLASAPTPYQVEDLARRLADTETRLDRGEGYTTPPKREGRLQPGWVYACSEDGLLYIGADDAHCGWLSGADWKTRPEDSYMREDEGEHPVAYVGVGYKAPHEVKDRLRTLGRQ